MKTSQLGREDILESEEVRYAAYLDTGGVWTNGVGHTGPDVHEGQVVDQAQVDAWLAEDLKDAEDAVNRRVKVPLTQGQYDALVSFVFNIGEPQFKNSTLLRLLNVGKYNEAREQLHRWKYDNGKEIRGLVNRRKREAARWNS